MSLVSKRKSINSRSSSTKRLSRSDSFQSKKSVYSLSFTSEHGSKFGRSVAKFPKTNDPELVQSVPTVNSRVIQTIINFPVKINSKLPDLTLLEATDCIRELGSFMNILDYEFNYTSFWLLDILSKLIKHMQLKEFPVQDQNICLTWFRYVLRCISISGDSREEIFDLLQKMFLKAEELVKLGDPIPQPEEINIVERRSSKLSGGGDIGSALSSKSFRSMTSNRKRPSQKSSRSIRKSSLHSHSSKRSNRSNRSSKSSKSNPRTSSDEKVEMNLESLNSIIDIIYNVFADRFLYSLIHQAYSSPTIVAPVEIPIDFRDPKLLRPPIVLTPPVSPSSKKTSASKSGKKGKDKGKNKRKASSSPKDEPEAGDKDAKSSKKKSKGKDASSKKDEGEGGKGKKKSKPSLDNEVQEPKSEPKGKGKETKKKSKKKSKSSEDVKATQENKGDADNKSLDTIKKIKKSITLEEAEQIRAQQIEEKLKLFDRPPAPEMKLEIKKIELKDKFILPLSEGVSKGYVENLIKSIQPPEEKLLLNKNVPKGNSEEKTKKSSSLGGKKNKSSKADKKAKGKKK